MLKLTEFLLACKIPLNLVSYKIHLATGNEHPPLEAFFAGKFKEWQEHQTRKNFPCDMVIGLIELSKNKWLFVGVFRVLGCVKKSENNIAYKTELLPGQDDFIGRIIVEHAREGRRASYLIGKADGGAFSVSEVREKKMSVEEFPGFNSVCVSFPNYNSSSSNRFSLGMAHYQTSKGSTLLRTLRQESYMSAVPRAMAGYGKDGQAMSRLNTAETKN